ncbi:MAG: rhodanese-like domain-containing protein [Crocinitomicaceae bacterium]
MKNILLLLFVGFGLSGFSQETEKEQTFDEMVRSYYKKTVPLIYPHQLYKKMMAKEKMYLLDTRESKEFEVSTLKNAMHVGFIGFNMNKVKAIDKKATIIMYCTIGARSETIGEKLKKNGYTNVYNLYGGLMHWKNEGYKVYKGSTVTNNIHVYSKKWGKWLNVGKPVY